MGIKELNEQMGQAAVRRDILQAQLEQAQKTYEQIRQAVIAEMNKPTVGQTIKEIDKKMEEPKQEEKKGE